MEVPPVQSLATQALLEYSQHLEDGKGVYGRAWVLATEVLGMIPSRVAEIIMTACADALRDTLDKTRVFYLARLQQRRGYDLRISQIRDASLNAFEKFRRHTNARLVAATGVVENFLYTNCYEIDESLCRDGWLRFSHHDSIDYTHLDEAATLGPRIETAEKELTRLYEENAQMRHEIAELESVEREFAAVDAWIGDTPSNLTDMVSQLNTLATRVQESTEVCDRRVEEKRRALREPDPFADFRFRFFSQYREATDG